jgi:hypothetical protein
MGEIQYARGRIVLPGAPSASKLSPLALDLLAQLFHLTEKGAEFF